MNDEAPRCDAVTPDAVLDPGEGGPIEWEELHVEFDTTPLIGAVGVRIHDPSRFSINEIARHFADLVAEEMGAPRQLEQHAHVDDEHKPSPTAMTQQGESVFDGNLRRLRGARS